MTMDEREKMPTWDVVETEHKNWLQHFGNKIICLFV